MDFREVYKFIIKYFEEDVDKIKNANGQFIANLKSSLD